LILIIIPTFKLSVTIIIQKIKNQKKEFVKLYCTNCGQEILDNAQFCPHCGSSITGTKVIQDTQAPAPVVSQAPSGAIQQLPSYSCPRCGNTGPKKSAYSTGLFIFLLCCIGCLAGLIYYLLRHGKVKCLQCGKVF
jgi:predicted RNA-binding Zn-ribbon protein involved in translation (DUF1610 family)